MKDKDKSSVDDIREFVDIAGSLLDGATDFAEEHQGEIDRLRGESDGIDLGDGSPLNMVNKKDEVVEVAIEADDSDMDSVSMEPRDGEVVMTVGESSVRVDMPSDASLGNTEAVYNNGILTVRIPRGGEE